MMTFQFFWFHPPKCSCPGPIFFKSLHTYGTKKDVWLRRKIMRARCKKVPTCVSIRSSCTTYVKYPTKNISSRCSGTCSVARFVGGTHEQRKTPPSADRKVRTYEILPLPSVNVLRSSIYDSPGPRARGRTMPPTTWQGAGKTL